MIPNAEQLVQLAKKYGLQIVAHQQDFDKSGLDFFVLHARDVAHTEWILRTPRHPKAYEGTFNEAKALALLRGGFPVSVPEWRVHEQDLIAYPRLMGTPGWSYDPDNGLVWNGLDAANPQRSFLESSARFLACLHSIESSRVVAAGVKQRTISQVRAEVFAACESTREVLKPSLAIWQRWQQWLADDSYWPLESTFVHGDLHPGHMLLDASLSVTGVLDWTEAGLGDPAVDFGIFFGCFGESTLQTVLHLYQDAGGRIHERFADHVMERWGAYAPLVAHWGMKHANAAVIEHAKAHLESTEVELK